MNEPVTMGNAAGCNVCGSDIPANGPGGKTDSNRQSRAAGSGCDNDESVVRRPDNDWDHQLSSFSLRMWSIKHVNLFDMRMYARTRV